MPIITSKTLFTQRLGTSGFSFSATRVGDLGASEYTLVGVAADCSSSVSPFAAEIEACIKEVVRACRRSPRADRLMLRLVTFDSKLREVHGFRPLAECPEGAYDGTIRCEGTTALHDAATTLVQSVGAYGKTLHAADSMWVVRGSFPSPMGGGYAAFLERASADDVAARTSGRVARLASFTGGAQ